MLGGTLDINALIQLLTGAVGGTIGGWVIAWSYRGDNHRLGDALNKSYETRIANLEEGQKACEHRNTVLLQYVLTLKGDKNAPPPPSI